MTESNKKQLRKLYNKYELSTDDVFTSPQGWIIVNRSGIDKIQAKADILIAYELVVSDIAAKTYVVKATGTYMPSNNPLIDNSNKSIQTYGESSPDNTRQKYPVAMAEKRAMSRVVLKLAGFYEAGAMGIDESDDFSAVKKVDRKPIGDLIKETL